MCGIIGAVIKTPTKDDLQYIRSVFISSKIRGLHATGISYIKNNSIVTIKEPVSADKFLPLSNLRELINEDGNLYLIGHCRYSTSDIEYNQPLASDSVSIVHNGVISQESPENWKQLFGYDCQTKNDSELLLQSISESPLIKWKYSSIAACELHSDKRLRFYRNGKRPLYYSVYEDNKCIIASTKDILQRSNLANIMPCGMNEYMTLSIDDILLFKSERISTKQKDYQL